MPLLEGLECEGVGELLVVRLEDVLKRALSLATEKVVDLSLGLVEERGVKRSTGLHAGVLSSAASARPGNYAD